ncbi:GNAT family N-acetyltransferase [Bdellovibrio sp. KM01]|uniref:GNAT family N-acetyltransferase n=1 Tax=Bdellovibrio sp. KM01 TaxID=2748865 RepID=UPI0015EA7B84|nr:GNAT family protein [Bdellovibrio sp. KM01]QLY26887.1 GNAT family N-acetyltransferase [Bdellovibrio sp. KM01]
MRISNENVITKKNKAVTLRSPDLEDAESLIHTMIEVAATSPHIIMTGADFQAKTIEEEQAWIRKYNEAERGLTILAEFENKIVGILDFMGGQRAKTRHRGTLGISLHSSMRGEGLGQLLFEKLLTEVKNIEGFMQIELSLMSENHTAFHLYKKVGFREIGRRPNAYRMADGTFNDEIMMLLPLT